MGPTAPRTPTVPPALSSDAKSAGRQSPSAQPTKPAVTTTSSKSTGNLTSGGERRVAESLGSGKLRHSGVVPRGDGVLNIFRFRLKSEALLAKFVVLVHCRIPYSGIEFCVDQRHRISAALR